MRKRCYNKECKDKNQLNGCMILYNNVNECKEFQNKQKHRSGK